MRGALKELVNTALARCGLRLVNAAWGPMGFQKTLRRLVDAGWKPRQIVDVGAFKGTWTAECMMLCPNAHYLLIDPLPSNCAALRELYERQPLAHEVITYLGTRDFAIADVCTYAQSADGSLEQSDLLFLRKGFS